MATKHESEPANKKIKTASLDLSSVSPLSGAYPTSDRFIRLLLGAKVDVVRPPENKIFVAQRTDNITEVWKGLAAHNFLSVPVLQKTKNKWYGFVDIYDIVKFVIEFFGVEGKKLQDSEDWLKLVESSEEFSKKTVNDIMKYPLSKRNPFNPIHSGYSLLTAVEALAREPGLHRIPIIDQDRKLITVISQSQVVQILYKNLDIIGEKKNKPVGQMDRYLEQVFTIHEEATAVDAFKMMVELNVSGLAVIDKEGKLTANIAMKDLKAVSTDTRLFWRLFQTVHNFLQKVRKENSETGGDRPRTTVTVKAEDTLETVIRRLTEHSIHRIYIVDDHKKPLGVISLKDVLAELIS
jgi:CBS-domain-containing membrane protein